MAFVSRAQRQLHTVTNSGIGPGAYINQSHYASNPGFAPFTSTSERDISKILVNQQLTPGPGSYLTHISQSCSSRQITGATPSPPAPSQVASGDSSTKSPQLPQVPAHTPCKRTGKARTRSQSPRKHKLGQNTICAFYTCKPPDIWLRRGRPRRTSAAEEPRSGALWGP